MARRIVTPDGSRRDQHWYKSKLGENVHDMVVPYAKTLLKNAESRHAKNRARERIYEGIELAQHVQALQALEAAGATMARLNALKSIIDTFTSRLTKDRPMPSFDPIDADWALKHRAKEYRRFIVGKMKDTEYDELSREAVLDGGILGNAFTLINDGEDDVYAERVHPNEMLFDDRECRYGKPQQGMRVQRIARDYLVELFPRQKVLIEQAPPSARRPDDQFDRYLIGDLDDYVDTFSAWHLPSTPDSEDGRYALCIGGGTLIHIEWLEPRFPWSMLRLFKPRIGLWGNGFVDQLAPIQHRVNCIVRDLQLNIAATGRGHFLVNEQNDLAVEMLTGWQPFKLKFKGAQPPTYVAPTPFNPAQLSALEFFINKMYDLSGVSQANAESKSTLGPGASGVALDTQYDIDSDRFRMPQANYAHYRLDGAQLYIDGAARVARKREAEKGKKRSYVAVSWKTRDAIDRLDYDKVVLEEGQYRLQIEPVNFLPDTRAGKLSVVEQLAKAGVIPQWMVPTLFDDPDITQANRILLAPYRNALKRMDILASVDKPMPMPEPGYHNLDIELEVAKGFYNSVQEEDAPEEIQDRFRRYVDLVVNALAAGKKPDPNMMPPAGMPGAPGMPGSLPPEPPMPGGVPQMPAGPVPPPTMIGAQ